MILLDTTILVYAVGGEHPLRAPARQVIGLLRDGSLRATTTVEVIQEFTHVRSRRRPRGDAASLARNLLIALSPLVRPDEDDLGLGLDLFEREEGLGPFDAVLAAVALNRGLILASADRSFSAVAELVHADPALPGFLDDLARAGQ